MTIRRIEGECPNPICPIRSGRMHSKLETANCLFAARFFQGLEPVLHHRLRPSRRKMLACGEVDDYYYPSRWHHHEDYRRGGSAAICGKAKAEAAWNIAEGKVGHPLPMWEPSSRLRKGLRRDNSKPTAVYMLRFPDGAYYFGSSISPESRLKGHIAKPVGNVQRWVAEYGRPELETLAWFDNRYRAKEAEYMLIETCSGDKNCLNVVGAEFTYTGFIESGKNGSFDYSRFDYARKSPTQTLRFIDI